jgi:hypothetical protein
MSAKGQSRFSCQRRRDLPPLLFQSKTYANYDSTAADLQIHG